MIAIFGISLVVFMVGLGWAVCRATARREAAWREMIRRRAEDSDRELMFARPYDDSTVTLPVIEVGK